MRPFAGCVAQLVEQRTENPCVAGSIPAAATILFSIVFSLLGLDCAQAAFSGSGFAFFFEGLFMKFLARA